MRKLVTILCFYLLLGINPSHTQNDFSVHYNDPTFTTPEVAAIIKQIDYKPNLYNGLVNITIPIYEIKEGDITLPISISYHSSGVKYKERCGKIGMGWTLNAEPSISRSIKGEPDEYSYLLGNNFLIKKRVENDMTSSNSGLLYEFNEKVSRGVFDLQPDAFYYNLPHTSGKFYYKKTNDRDNEIVLCPYEPIQISGAPYPGYNIIDDRGIQYLFNNNFGGFGWAGANKIQWLCDKIISANKKNNIMFTYTDIIPNNLLTQDTDYAVVEEFEEPGFDIWDPTVYGIGSQCGNLFWPFIVEFYDMDYRLSNIVPGEDQTFELENGDLVCNAIRKEKEGYPCYPYSSPYRDKIRSQFIKTINSQHIEITFFYNPEHWYQNNLERIEIKDKLKNEVIRKVFFIKAPGASPDRWLLGELKITDKDDVLIEHYKFEHHSPLTRLMGDLSDYWGFAYDGGSINEADNFPLQTIKIKVPDAINGLKHYRLDIGSYHKPFSRGNMGMLKSITYITGRKSTFYYEPHQYMHDYFYDPKPDNTYPEDQYGFKKRDAGGVRIRKIEEYDPLSNQTYIKEYKYGQNEDGTGYIVHQPSKKDFYLEYYNVYGTTITKTRRFLPNTLAETTFMGGTPVVYGFVTEYLSAISSNGTKTNNGKIEYAFTYNYPSYEHIEGTPLNRSNENDWIRGQLGEKYVYKYDGTSPTLYSLIEKNEYYYDSFKENRIPYYMTFAKLQPRSGYELFRDNFGVRQRYKAFESVESTINTGCVRLAFEEKTSYTDNGIFTNSKEYIYGNHEHLYPTKIITKDSNKEIKTEMFTYPKDISYRNAAEQKLLDNNQQNSLIEKKATLGGRVWINKTEYRLNNGNPVPSVIRAGITGKDENRATYHDYDTYGNPLYISKDEELKTVYLWSYAGKYPIAEIKNATYAQVKAALNWNDNYINTVSAKLAPSDSDMENINNLRTSLPLSIVTTYKYDPLVGITEATDAAKITTFYSYDSFGRLKESYIKENNIKKIIQSYDYHYQQQ